MLSSNSSPLSNNPKDLKKLSSSIPLHLRPLLGHSLVSSLPTLSRGTGTLPSTNSSTPFLPSFSSPPPFAYTSVLPFAKKLACANTLNGHEGCVNTITWSKHGIYMASGSGAVRYHPLHSVPNRPTSTPLLSTSNSSTSLPLLQDYAPLPPFQCHSGLTYMVLPDRTNPSIFYSCSDDGKLLRYDLRRRTSCPCQEEECHAHAFIDYKSIQSTRRSSSSSSSTSPPPPRREGSEERTGPSSRSSTTSWLSRMLPGVMEPSTGITCFDLHPFQPHVFTLATNDDKVSFIDARWPCQFLHQYIPSFYRHHQRRFLAYKITDVRFDPYGSGEVLVFYARQALQLIRPSWHHSSSSSSSLSTSLENESTTENKEVVQMYSGHRNELTMIKEANFFGTDTILCGSDDGYIYVYDRETADLVHAIPADARVVNCVQPHPDVPYVLASGIDHTLKILQPMATQPVTPTQLQSLVQANHQASVLGEYPNPSSTLLVRLLALQRNDRTHEDTSEVNDDEPMDDDDVVASSAFDSELDEDIISEDDYFFDRRFRDRLLSPE
ncbi:DDB1- and CUL4-associated factor 6 [Coelomomyces lativittatus]|nr:DDB1- and CUL4-associated factor 6 [Coelomomyces lativittatus]